MNFPQQVCRVSNKLTQPSSFHVFITIIVFILFLFLINKITKSSKKVLYKYLACISILFWCFFLWIIGNFALWIILGEGDNPPSVTYHPLNAMIKLRCYEELGSPFCPKKAKDVYQVAPDYLKDKLSTANITYYWYPDIKDYTLIIRNNNYHYNNDRVAIFDPRLKKGKIYGRQGLDFFDANIVSNCNGTFTIINPPPFPGPWNIVN